MDKTNETNFFKVKTKVTVNEEHSDDKENTELMHKNLKVKNVY